MDALQCIMTRRAVRSFTGDPVTDEQIKTILEAAMMAPSAGNSQTWRFIVIRDKNTLHDIIKVHPHAHMLEEAACAIVVCSDTTKEKFPGYWVQDCSNATQNMMLAAHAIGLGSVWLGIWTVQDRVDGLIDMFKLPEGVMPLSIVALGKPAATPAQPQRWDDSKVHWEKW